MLWDLLFYLSSCLPPMLWLILLTLKLGQANIRNLDQIIQFAPSLLNNFIANILFSQWFIYKKSRPSPI